MVTFLARSLKLASWPCYFPIERVVAAHWSYWGSDTAERNSWDKVVEDAGTVSNNSEDVRREGRILDACRDPSAAVARGTLSTCERNPRCSSVLRMLDRRVLLNKFKFHHLNI